MTIRQADRSEIESLSWTQLYSEDNDGDDFLVCERDGRVAAWAQTTGDTIYFIESVGGGAGTAIVDWMKSEYGRVVADNCVHGSATYWERQGFTRMPGRYGIGMSNNYEWIEED